MHRLFAAAAVLALPACSTMPQQVALPEADVQITGVTVIDPETRSVTAARDVYIDDGRIVEIAPAGSSRRTAERSLAGEGRFLIPGLMDMHAHSSFRPVHISSLKLMVANGVTGIREMGSDCVEPGGITMCLGEMREAQANILAGEQIGPRIVELSTAKIDSQRPEDASERVAAYRPTTPAEARATVTYFAAEGPDILKVGDQFEPDAFRALAGEATARGMKFGGHIPPMLSVAEVAAMGMISIEHARDLPLDCSTFGAEYRGAILAKIRGEAENWPDRRAMPGKARDTFDQATCDAQIAAMRDNGTYYVPTLLTREMDYRAGEAAYRDDPRLAYIPAMQAGHWNGDLDRTASMPAELVADLGDFFRLTQRTTGMAHKAGVKIMTGTDANDTMVFPGFSLHDELRHLVGSGLSEMDVLRASSTVPAEYLGRSAELGGVSVGKLADLVLLRADPLADIGNTTQIEAVFVNGRLYDRAALEGLLADVRAWVVQANAMTGD